MISIRTAEEIEKMRRSGELVARVLDLVHEMVVPNVTPAELNKAAQTLIESEGATPAFLGYRGYPATLCVSVDSEVVHGIPGDKPLAEGQIVSVDVGAILDGYYGDSARTFAVGQVSDEALGLMKVTQDALASGIDVARAGNRIGAIGEAVSAVASAGGASVVRALTGHGIGTEMHEPPQIPNYGSADEGEMIENGMIFAIEPMLNLGTHEVDFLDDGWTVRTKDGSLSAHFEHTIAVTASGPDILTVPAQVTHG